jgi:exosortase
MEPPVGLDRRIPFARQARYLFEERRQKYRFFMIKKYRILLERILPFAVFGALWYLLIKHLSAYWTLNPQYSFGWFAPVICAYLIFMRWITRPSPGPAPSHGAQWAFWIAAFALLPTWLVEQPNPDWRLLSWLLTLEIVILSLCAIYFVGGKSWLKHFGFSVCFILLAVPWPKTVEEFVIQGLTQTATLITVTSLNLFQIWALQHGNLIEVKTGLLGVDEACSGIRSLEATLMVSLFLGELYRTNWQRRVLLVLSGVLIAFLCNVGRTFLLCSVAAKSGTEAISKWHDPAGFIILSICFFVLWGLAHFISGTPARLEPSKAFALRPFPRGLIIALGAWLLITVLGAEIWYRTHETGQTLRWSFELPTAKDHFSDVQIPDDLGLGDTRRAASWTESDGSYWTAFFFKWDAGPPSSRILARMHRPENCLPKAGYKLQGERDITINAKDLIIPFRALDFDHDGRRVYVFFCLWQDHLKPGEELRIRDHWDDRLVGLESVLLGERNLGQQTLEIVISGYATSQEAEGALRRQMENLIRT